MVRVLTVSLKGMRFYFTANEWKEICSKQEQGIPKEEAIKEVLQNQLSSFLRDRGIIKLDEELVIRTALFM